LKENQIPQAAFENILDDFAVEMPVGSLDGGAPSSSPRVNQTEWEAVKRPQKEIQYKQNNQ
jgi:hypothetical protein